MIADRDYIEKRMKYEGNMMDLTTHKPMDYEYHKGQFLAFREILYPERYGTMDPYKKKHAEAVIEELRKGPALVVDGYQPVGEDGIVPTTVIKTEESKLEIMEKKDADT